MRTNKARPRSESPASGLLVQTVGALRQFGLLTVEEGTGRDRTVRLTDRALRTILDKRENERRKAIQEAALAPKLYAHLWEKWGRDLPSDGNAESYLTLDMEFNPSSAAGVFADYKDTLAFAQLPSSATMPSGADDVATPEEDTQDVDPAYVTDTGSVPLKGQPLPLAALGDREEEYFRARLAGGRMVRVLFQGEPPTQAEIGKLIALLELSKDQYPAG